MLVSTAMIHGVTEKNELNRERARRTVKTKKLTSSKDTVESKKHSPDD